MSTKHIRSISDFARFCKDIDVVCGCGHKATLFQDLIVVDSWRKVGLKA